MNRVVQSLAAVAIVGLLAAILALLFGIARDGIRIEHTGTVDLTGMVERVGLTMSEPIVLTMPEPGRLITTGPDGTAVPISVELATCPECGGAMVPVRWNLWTGEIEWRCRDCGEAITAPSRR